MTLFRFEGRVSVVFACGQAFVRVTRLLCWRQRPAGKRSDLHWPIARASFGTPSPAQY